MIKVLILSCVWPFLQVAATLDDPAAEARAQDLMREIRCVACENEPISQSGSEIAADMRARVRDMVSQGYSDEEIRDWFVARYGAFVLFRPPVGGLSGGLLWGLPFFLFLAGAGALILQRRNGSLSDEVEAVAADHPDGSGE